MHNNQTKPILGKAVSVLTTLSDDYTKEQTTTEQSINLVTQQQTTQYDNKAENTDSLIMVAAELNKASPQWYFEKQGTIPLPQYSKIESDKPIQYSGACVVSQMEVKRNRLHLGTHTRCVCEETGIVFGVELPNPLDVSMTLLHPFAFYSNVDKFVRNYQRHGLRFDLLEQQVLAGMLITILAHKKLSVCYDPIKANENLRQAEKTALITAIGYFNFLQLTNHLPQINLLDSDWRSSGSWTSSKLLSYISICKGTDQTVQALHAHEKKTGKIQAKRYCPKCQSTDCACPTADKVKIPQTEQAKQEIVLKQDTRTMNQLLEKLELNNLHVSKATYKLFKARISKVAVMTQQAKEQFIEELYDVFDSDENIKTLSALAFTIRSVNTDEIQKDLLTFTQELEQEQQAYLERQRQQAIDNPQDPTGLRGLMAKLKG